MHIKLIYTLLIGWGLTACSGEEPRNIATGRFETDEVTVAAKAQGEIVRLYLEEGQTVMAGQRLGVIDTAQLVLQREELLAHLSATDSRRINAHRQLAALRQQIENVKTEQQRFETLVADRAAAQKQLDDLHYQRTVLERELGAKEEEISRANLGVSGESAALLARVSQVDVQLRNCNIVSPVAGTIVAQYAECGEYAQTGRPLFKVAPLSEMTLRAYLTAEQMASVRLGQQVEVRIDETTEKQKTYTGKITWVADEAEFTPKTIQTRDERAHLVYAIKVLVKNDGYLKRGMYGEVEI